MPAKRKIAIFTGNRAEYGLQFPIIKAITEHPALECYLLVSGAHLQEDFGGTVKEIEKDGFSIYQEIELSMDKDTPYATSQAIGSGVLNISKVLNQLSPDFMVVYADRFESFAAMIASTQMNIPTAHIEGGDLTEGGALDDSVRHAMSKLAHLHFTTNEDASGRILNLGEEKWRVRNVGFPALDLIEQGIFATREEIEHKYSLSVEHPIIIFTQHSITTEYDKAALQIGPSLEAMQLLASEGCQVIVTYPNNDAGGRMIISEIEKFRSKNIKNAQIHVSLGRYNYHGVLNLCGKTGKGMCVGNSSSGIKETVAFGCPTVNIGSRQAGRLRADNVLDADYDCAQIVEACRKAICDESFRETCRTCNNPYGAGNAGLRIAETLSGIDINTRLLQKKMTY